MIYKIKDEKKLAARREKYRLNFKLKQYKREYYIKNKERDKQKRKEYYTKNIEKRLTYTKEKLLTKYGISKESYKKLLLEQFKKCAICEKPINSLLDMSIRKKDVANTDHDHNTGKVRGLLCVSCNIGLGGFKDNEILLEKAIKYLKRFNETNTKGL